MAAAQGSPPGIAGEAPAAEPPGPLSWRGLYNDCLDSDEDSGGSVMQAAGVAHGQEALRHRRHAAAQGQVEDEEAPRREEQATPADEPAPARGRQGGAEAVAASKPVGRAQEERTIDQPKGQARKSKDSPYNRLRRFATLCQRMFERAGLHLEDVTNPPADNLINQLTSQLGTTVLSNFQVDRDFGRDEYERFADLLNTCARTRLNGQQTRKFFDADSRGRRNKPNFEALHAAGLYPAAWQLPLEPAAVQEVQRIQAAARRPQGGDMPSALVGQRVAVWYPEDNWLNGTIVDIRPDSRVRIKFSDGDEDSVGLKGAVLFLGERAEHKLREAVAAIQRVYAGEPRDQDRLFALYYLDLAGVGGNELQKVAKGWAGCTAAQQEELFDAVAITAEAENWQRLEGRLQLALQLQGLAPQPQQ
ncbi:hypothetical protein ABPG77_006767 [Micractinium sp. CCAP 211/92]